MSEDEQSAEKSCWTCLRQQIGGGTFLGVCTYFETVGKENKPIPVGRVDVGCKFWEEKVRGAEEDRQG